LWHVRFLQSLDFQIRFFAHFSVSRSSTIQAWEFWLNRISFSMQFDALLSFFFFDWIMHQAFNSMLTNRSCSSRSEERYRLKSYWCFVWFVDQIDFDLDLDWTLSSRNNSNLIDLNWVDSISLRRSEINLFRYSCWIILFQQFF
jgi:hypothetical protein